MQRRRRGQVGKTRRGLVGALPPPRSAQGYGRHVSSALCARLPPAWPPRPLPSVFPANSPFKHPMMPPTGRGGRVVLAYARGEPGASEKRSPALSHHRGVRATRFERICRPHGRQGRSHQFFQRTHPNAATAAPCRERSDRAGQAEKRDEGKRIWIPRMGKYSFGTGRNEREGVWVGMEMG